MSVLGEVLAIKVALSGMEKISRQLKEFIGELGMTDVQLASIKSGFKELGVVVGVVGAALGQAANDDTMRRTLQGITHDGQLARNQMNLIRAEGEGGLFNKDEYFRAIKFFDETKTSMKELLPLSEELASRLGGRGHLSEAARALSSLAGGGVSRMQAILKQAGISVNELRGAGLNVSSKFEISGSPARVLAAMKKILGEGSVSKLLGAGLDAEIQGTIATIKDLFRSIGEGILPIAGPVLGFFKGMIKTMAFLNDLTRGWASNILLAVVAINGIRKVLPLFTALINQEKLAAVWATILKVLNNPWATMAQGIAKVVSVMKALISVEKIKAGWDAIIDALDGNWVALGAAAAVATGVGIAWHYANQEPDKDSAESPAERPTRRSDIENSHSRSRARAWA